MNLRCSTLAAGLLWLAASLPAHGQGTIRYVPNVNMGMLGIEGTFPWDIDGNGTTDFVFQSGGVTFSAYPQLGNHLLALPSAPPDVGSLVVPLGIPSELGNYDYTPFVWVGYQDQGGFPIGVGFNACSTIGCAGPFVGIKGYFGFNIEIDGQTHYGWALFNTSHASLSGGILEEYAYNLTPGAPIFVGQVPEPGAVTLLLVGAGLLGWQAWRHRQRI